ncbi:tyrosine-protein kinase receptor isoform X2 [Pectinophora gossypiella]|uniref:tyrosine-protein kinase receptor isoform X2 n=1 Tax=Pectinophora gossypiella TaxID=13191 RepID=UPI00214F086C|nr:tyrosine-protein kinase receptor isoform X2 [Pectinophora gossypiella]
MALWRVVITLAVVAAVVSVDHELKAENKAKKTLAAEREQKSRSASPGPEKGSFDKLSSMLNRTEHRRPKNRNRGKNNLNKIHQLNIKHRNQHDDMMNDNEGAIAINQKTVPDNDTNSLTDKMKALRREGPDYMAVDKYNYLPQVTGVYCNFENMSSAIDMCMWSWNSTLSSHGLGFSVVTAADVVRMNSTTRGLKFSGPPTDADENVGGHFLYLPVDPTMENMVIKSPPFRGLWEFCKFEARMHQSKMQNASIRLVSESTVSEVQWILQEVAGNNFEMWYPMRFTIGKVQQEVRIIIEITRPNYVSLSHPLPHIAIDNIRMVECLPEPPVFNGQCQHGQLKCNIINKESCIKLQQVCDLVKDCDDGSDETQNCDKMPYGSYCNFEHDNCGFENVPQPILKWSRHNGPTPTDKTGPNYDHTCGPPDPYPTMLIPPLFPAHMNYSLSQCVGYYFFVNMNVTGPNKEKADFASTAVMKTVIFNPPPKVHGNITSKYYNCCMIRFYYQQNGRNYGSLSVDLVELTSRGNTTTSLWFSTKDKGENWYRAAIFLPNVTRRYYLQFKTRMGMRIYSDSAIDDFSMAPECFGLNIDPQELGDYNYYDPVFEEKTTPHAAFADQIFYRFTTCGATGRTGPNQTMCDVAYNNTPVSVTVMPTPPYQGIQVWEVPAEGIYTIIATGASGGLGSAWAGVSHGAQARALFELHKSEHIYMLVGQQGMNACKKTLSAQEGQICSRQHQNDSLQVFTSKTHEVRNTQVHDGGGGGGGATYVFLLDKEGQALPLLVAGGGGGISVGIFRDDGSQHGKPHTNATPESGWMYGEPGRTSGAGGGWVSRAGPITPGFELVRGNAVKEGGVGGRACAGQADGGFGGGGGGCLRGGGGGGWLGGNTNDGEGNHGGGGWSYIDASRAIREYSEVTVAQRTGPGEVLILPAIHDCGCDYRCVALNEYRSDIKCYCPASWSTDAHDATKCILEDSWPRISWMVVIALSVAVFVCAIGVIGVCLYLYNTYQRKKEAEVRQKRLLEQEVQLHRLRNAPGNNENALSMAFNPHYGSEGILPPGVDVRGLPQVSRESLKLVKALGQGAFGEVYQGLYRHRTGDSVEMPVAVKTLPELSTGQAETDFLMEAAIMAKFNHPNIVHLIGVCFDRHPRFIVLELLAGGDLKNFLRESRPKPERASALTMKDLLLCSLDVCKGCRYLEAKRFIHRDIAARNCLLTSRGPGRVVKIADFGMARDIYRADYYKKGGKAMLPIKWMPPEAYIDGVFTVKTDVWSYGVLLWEVFSLGVMPYTGCANREVMDMVSGGGRLEKPYGCPQEIYRLMCECWNPNPDERPAFAHMFDRLQRFLQDPEIVSAPLPIVKSVLPPPTDVDVNSDGSQRAPACDYLVPMSPQDNPEQTNSSTDQLVPHSKSPTAAQDQDETEDSPYPPLLKASQEYGNIPMVSRGGSVRGADGSVSSVVETRATKFLPSNSTDRLLDGVSLEDDSASENEDSVDVYETSFTEVRPKSNSVEFKKRRNSGPMVDKLISITPTSPKPPENALSKTIELTVIDKTNHKSLGVERKTAPIASPDPPRINAWPKDAPKLAPKPKPLCLDAAQLEQNLNALKKNSGSVNLTTMNILPPYINVVTPNKLSESKTIQIDPKKAVIHDLQSPKDEVEEKGKLKQSNSAASLLNGPMTDVPYADSDNASTSSGSNGPNGKNNKKNKNNYTEIVVGNDRSKIIKQGSNGKDSEISC